MGGVSHRTAKLVASVMTISLLFIGRCGQTPTDIECCNQVLTAGLVSSPAPAADYIGIEVESGASPVRCRGMLRYRSHRTSASAAALHAATSTAA